METEAKSDRVGLIFRAYDIRGVYREVLTEEVMESIGLVFSGLVEGDTAVLARDGRVSGSRLSRAFSRGVLSGGKNVIDLGVVPLGVGMFHAWRNGKTFAYVTASHLGKEWNGIKFFSSTGIGFMEEEMQAIKESFFGKITESAGKGKLSELFNEDVISEYVSHLVSRIRPEGGLRVALDPGNGAAGLVVRKLFTEAGFDIFVANENVDGRFPGRSPDPVTDPLSVLKKSVREMDMGIAYDGDGDRMVVVDSDGNKLAPEKVAYIILSELLKEQAGPVVANVESSRTIDSVAVKFGRKVIRVRVGHNYLIKATSDHKACFGMEPSGHYSVPWIFPFDDSLAISYYLACAVSRKSVSLSELVSGIPSLPFERINFDVPDERKFEIMDRLREGFRKRYSSINTMDGVRVEFENGWVLVRPSNTQPRIRLTIEAKTRADLEALKDEASGLLKRYIKT